MGNFTINGRDLAEFVTDAGVAFAAFWFTSGVTMDSEATVAAQPLAFFVSIAVGLGTFKLMRQFDLFKPSA